MTVLAKNQQASSAAGKATTDGSRGVSSIDML
jgi:hypothetical protein